MFCCNILKSEVLMKKLFLMPLMLMLLCTFLTECGDKENDSKDKELYAMQSNDGKIECIFDIDRDGASEVLTVDYSETQNDEQIPATLDIKKDGKLIWYSEVGIPHAGWGSYYIIVYENNVYLLNYVPEESQGLESYYYKLFRVDSEGNEVVADENSGDSTITENFEEMKEEFNKKVSAYLENSTLLISTLEGELIVYPDEH